MEKSIDNLFTFCFFYKFDNEERRENLKGVLEFYSKNFTDSNFSIVIEDHDDISKDLSILDTYNLNIIIHKKQEKDLWNKSNAYNSCIKTAETDILIFNDVDVIVSPDQIREAGKFLCKNENVGLIYPYDGRFLCVDKDLKKLFISKHDLYILEKYEPKTSNINDSTEHVFVGHNNSPGGIVMGRKDNLVKAGGYNTDFCGWGYEDSEILSRMKILGFKCGRVMTGPCWHLDHSTNDSSKKEHQPFYERNRLVCSHIESLNSSQLWDYCKNKNWLYYDSSKS